MDLYKKKAEAVNDRSEELMDEGFDYPVGSGNMFGLEDHDLIMWIAILVLKDMLTYPFRLRTKAFTDSDNAKPKFVYLTDSNDVLSFINVALGSYLTVNAGGNAVLDQLVAALDLPPEDQEAALNAVVDPR